MKRRSGAAAVSPGALAGETLRRAGPRGAIALLLDYDGTLVPLAATPDRARADADLVRLLEEVVAAPRLVPAVVTGRTLADLDSVVQVPPGFFVFATHGAHVRNPDGTEGDLLRDPEGERIINVVREECRGWDPPSGVWVEEKGIALGLHYRRASAEDAERARRWFRARVKAADPGGRLRVIEGKRILEVRPGGLDKGLAVARMKRVAPTVTVYLGDDTTDEDAFAALEGNDLGILVGPGERPTAAGFRLADSGEARRFLRELAFRIREEGR